MIAIQDLAMGTCPFCRRGSLRIIAAITHEEVITRILRHLKLPAVTKRYWPSTSTAFRKSVISYLPHFVAASPRKYGLFAGARGQNNLMRTYETGY